MDNKERFEISIVGEKSVAKVIGAKSKSVASRKPDFYHSFLMLLGILALSIVCFGGFIYCKAYYPFWSYVGTRGFTALSEYRSSSIRGLHGRQILVHRRFLPIMNRLEDYAHSSGIQVIVTQSYRNPEKKVRGARVTPAQRSNHLAGHAIDINIRFHGRLFMFDHMKKRRLAGLPRQVRDFIELVRKDPEMRWGGDFQREDPVHIDDGINLQDHTLWAQHVDNSRKDMVDAKPKWKFW